MEKSQRISIIFFQSQFLFSSNYCWNCCFEIKSQNNLFMTIKFLIDKFDSQWNLKIISNKSQKYFSFNHVWEINFIVFVTLKLWILFLFSKTFPKISYYQILRSIDYQILSNKINSSQNRFNFHFPLFFPQSQKNLKNLILIAPK